MRDYDDDDDIIVIIHLKTEIVVTIRGATITTPQPSRTCTKDKAMYGQLN